MKIGNKFKLNDAKIAKQDVRYIVKDNNTLNNLVVSTTELQPSHQTNASFDAPALLSVVAVVQMSVVSILPPFCVSGFAISTAPMPVHHDDPGSVHSV